MTKVVPQKVNLTGQKAFTSYMKNPVSFVVPIAIGFATLTSVAFAESPSAPSTATKEPASAAKPAATTASKPAPSPAPPRPDSPPSLPVRLPPPVAADKKACFQLEAKAKDMTKEPQLLCVEPVGTAGSTYTLRLSTGRPGSATEVAVFNFQLQSRARCIDCNMDVFALTNPSNSVFNKLSIVFKGKRDVAAGTESGTVKIGATQFYYRVVK